MILETKVSYFEETRDTEVKSQILIGTVLERIKNGTYENIVKQLRSGDKEIKKSLPTIAMHGLFDGFRKKDLFAEASGLVILDLDDVELDEIEETKQDIIESNDHVLAIMTSPSGNGIKILYYVMPELITADSYRAIGKQLVSEFDIYGTVDFLSVTDCLIMTYDPNILINEDAIPAHVFVKEVIKKEAELEPLDESKQVWEDPEDFFDTVLAEDISQKTNSNFHFIQVSLLDLAKFGFYHPKEDLTFVIDYAESYFKYSTENKKRFSEAAELANQYPQQYWPYRLGRTDDDFEEDEGFNDYSEFIATDDVIKPKKDKSDSEDGEEEDFDGFIDLKNFLDRVISVVKEGDRVGFEVSLKNFADVFRPKGTGICTVTGIPGHGKTEFVDALLVDLARLYGHEAIIAGFEQTPEEHNIKLIRKILGLDVTCPSWFDNKDNHPRFHQALEFTTRHFHHFDIAKTGGDINVLLRKAAERIAKLRAEGREVKYMVMDPFNMLSIKGRYSGHEKIEEILRRLTHFSHQMGVMVILVAHPFKMKKNEETGQYAVPDFYSVKGSSAFFEMSYHGLTVYRRDDGLVMIKVLKVKQNNMGEREAEVFFDYDRPSGRYIPVTEEMAELAGDHRDRDWLEKALEFINNKN